MFCRLLHRVLKRQGAIMADLTKLNADIAALKALIVAQHAAPLPVDDQPAIDAAAAEVDSMIALLTPALAPAA
jgi:hypothetical protein